MNRRSEELLSAFFDDALAPHGMEELLQNLRESEGLKKDFRTYLCLHEILSQELNPARSEQAFVDGLTTRLRAESDASGFVARVIRKAGNRRLPRISIVPLLAAASLLIAVGVFIFTHRQPSAISVQPAAYIAKDGGVRVMDSGEVPLRASEDLPVDTRVKTRDGEASTFSYREESTLIRLAENGELVMGASPDTAKQIRLVRGSLKAWVDTQPAGKPLRFLTDYAEVLVRGTVLTLMADANGMRVDVLSGTVDVRPLGSATEQVIPVGSSHSLLIDRKDDRLVVLGEVLLDEDFDRGFDNWYMTAFRSDGSSTGVTLPPSGTAKEAIRIGEFERNGETVKCLLIDGMSAPGQFMNLNFKKRFAEQDLIAETVFMVVDGGEREW